MKKYLPLAAAVLVGCTGMQQAEDWTRADTYRQIAYSSMLAIDAAQTARIHENPTLEEGQPITRAVLGPQPDPAETYAAALLLGFAHYWIGNRIGPRARKIWQYVGITIHTQAVSQNCDNGLC